MIDILITNIRTIIANRELNLSGAIYLALYKNTDPAIKRTVDRKVILMKSIKRINGILMPGEDTSHSIEISLYSWVWRPTIARIGDSSKIVALIVEKKVELNFIIELYLVLK